MFSTTTSATLLRRLHEGGDADSWREFERRYAELIVRYARARGLQLADAEDVRQIVLTSLASAMPGFVYSPEKGRFRHYLGRVVRNAVNRALARPRLPAVALDVVEQPAAHDDSADEQWEREWVRHHYRRAMETVRSAFDPRSIAIFDRLLAGVDVSVVAGEFNTTAQAVHKVKQRVRDRLAEAIAAQLREEEGDDDASGSAPPSA